MLMHHELLVSRKTGYTQMRLDSPRPLQALCLLAGNVARVRRRDLLSAIMFVKPSHTLV